MTYFITVISSVEQVLISQDILFRSVLIIADTSRWHCLSVPAVGDINEGTRTYLNTSRF